MIILDELTSTGRHGPVLASVSAVLPSDRRIALLGRSDREKTLFIDILAGNVLPTKGRVVRNARVSFPVGGLLGFDGKLTVRVNVAHVARLYGADVRQVLHIVKEAFGSSGSFDRPYGDMPRDMRKPLSQVVAFALPFDTYLLTDHTQHPAANRRKGRDRETNFDTVSELLFQYRVRTSGVIIPTNDLAFAQEHCEMAIHLDRGRLELVEDVQQLEVGSTRLGRRRRLRQQRPKRRALE